MTVRQQRKKSIVVKSDEIPFPKDCGWLVHMQHQLHGCFQRLWPAINGAKRGCVPGVTSDQARHPAPDIWPFGTLAGRLGSRHHRGSLPLQLVIALILAVRTKATTL